MKAFAWLLAAILGYLIGGPLVAILVLVAGVVIALVTDMARTLISPFGLGFLVGSAGVWVAVWVAERMTGFVIESQPWWVVVGTWMAIPGALGLWVESRVRAGWDPQSLLTFTESPNTSPRQPVGARERSRDICANCGQPCPGDPLHCDNCGVQLRELRSGERRLGF